MSVGTSSLSVVGIRYSAVGVLELMWKPELTRNCKSTLLLLPRTTFAIGAGDIVTDGTFLGGASCAHSVAMQNPIENNVLEIFFSISANCHLTRLATCLPQRPCQLFF